MGDLQPVLNVDAFHVDKAAAELAAEVCGCFTWLRVCRGVCGEGGREWVGFGGD